jgi:glycosyltransferase involved in cell wall biosynthesis
LHIFGSPPDKGVLSPGVRLHQAPDDSRLAYAPGSILAVPLHIASGVRMKILEAWARGVAVVATPAAARGLGASPGDELLVAEEAGDFAAALQRLQEERDLYSTLGAAGRELLRRAHSPAKFATTLLSLYAPIIATGEGSGSSSDSMAATSAAISSR